METTISFEYDAETKNTIRYAEDSDLPIIGTLYVQKRYFQEHGIEFGTPITLTLKFEE